MSDPVTFGPLEVIASIVIVFALVKMTVFLISPNAWLDFAGKAYVRPNVTSAVALVLAVVVLFFMVHSGMTIVQILAAWVFLASILVASFARYADDIITWAKTRDRTAWLKEQWILMVIWLGLLVWGVIELLTS